MLSSVCCIRLNTYGVVISYLSLIVSTLATGVLFLFSANVTYSILTDVLYFILCACCFLVLVNIVTFTTMAVGIVQKKHQFMLPWLMNCGLLLVVLTIDSVLLWINLILYQDSLNIILIIFIINAGILGESNQIDLDAANTVIYFPGFGWYVYYGIYSLFKNIQTYRETPEAV
ncbi:uncharacterized protein LOC108112039 isoform X1 [Drosophila eugracilis]|uniref:uncharacterized protein LOC108112039 isoform X1 n=1 Tax=Drosophila eugracilis TaxID=29029 RepID=UPI001BD9DFE6|nr:uncharacterized protein LOC108112039 isoform X1 [Drosophila eugracilis]